MSDYLILSQNIPVAKWENSRLSVLNEQLLPLYLKRVANVDMWLETRAIDSHRANSRLLKKALRLTERDDISTARPIPSTAKPGTDRNDRPQGD